MTLHPAGSRSAVPLRAATCAVGCLLLSACGASARAGDPARGPWDEARGEVADALDEARESAERVSVITTVARYNPPECDCPPWEVLVGGNWERAWLRPDGALDESLAPFLRGEETEAGARVWISFVRSRDASPGATGWNYPIVDVTEVGEAFVETLGAP